MFPSKKKKNQTTWHKQWNYFLHFLVVQIERALQINLASIITINQLVIIHNRYAKFLGGKSPIKGEKNHGI